MHSRLLEILEHKKREVAERKAARPRIDVADAPPVRPFRAALEGDRVRLIAEVKRASPSRGVLRTDFDPLQLALAYVEGGAACLSVLTDERYFQGHDRYLQQIRERVALPILRKEFLVDPWQVAESRVLGADAILLIVAILNQEQLAEMARLGSDLGMAVLVEVHTGPELEQALAAGAELIGINNRNLHTFETDLATTERLGPVALTGGAGLVVSESGIFTAADVARVRAAGADAILVGEALVREGTVRERVRELASVPRG